MKEMQFPLDFVWISEGCTVVDITPSVPAPSPGTTLSQLPTYASGAPAAYNLELNAGEAEEYGLAIGDLVRFSGVPPGAGATCE